MNSIDIDWRALSAYVEECAKHANIHTVTVTLNGHGGADVTIQGSVPDVRGGSWGDVEYVRTYEVQ